MLMESFADRLAGKLVVWFVCLENDLEDNLSARHVAVSLAVRAADAQWFRVGDCTGSRRAGSVAVFGIRPQAPLAFPVPRGPLADRAYAAAGYLIGRAAACCRSVDAQLVLVTIPDPILLTTAGEERLAAITGKSDCDPSCRIAGSQQAAGKTELPSSPAKIISRPATTRVSKGCTGTSRGIDRWPTCSPGSTNRSGRPLGRRRGGVPSCRR